MREPTTPKPKAKRRKDALVTLGAAFYSPGLRTELTVTRIDGHDVWLSSFDMHFGAPLEDVVGHLMSGRWTPVT